MLKYVIDHLTIFSLQVDSFLFQPLRKTASMTIEAMKATTTSQPAATNSSPKVSPQLRKQTSEVRPAPEEVHVYTQHMANRYLPK